MWRGSCCLFVTLLMVIIGVCVDVLMVETGQTGDIFQITVDYGWRKMRWSANVEIVNATRSMVYSVAYDEYCNTTTSSDSFCTALKDLRDGGRVYLTFNIIGMALLGGALALSILAGFGKCLCNCKCHLRWIVAILCMLAVVSFLTAFGVFISDFSNNVNTVFNKLFPYLILTWQGAYIGGSVGCLITASCFGLIALSCILCVDPRRSNQVYSPLHDSTPSGFDSTARGQQVYVVYGQPPPMYAPYNQPPPTYVPYGEPDPNQVLAAYTNPPGTYYQQPQNPNITPV